MFKKKESNGINDSRATSLLGEKVVFLKLFFFLFNFSEDKK